MEEPAVGAEQPAVCAEQLEVGSPSQESVTEAANSLGGVPPPSEGDQEEGMDDTPQVDGRYAYVDRGFTSELYKLEVFNLPKHIGYQVCTQLCVRVPVLLYSSMKCAPLSP